TRSLLPGWSWSNCGYRRHWGNSAQPTPPEKRTGNDQRDAHNLHQRDAIVKHQRAAGIAAEKFDCAAFETVKKKVRANKLAGESLAPRQPNDDQKIQKLRHGFVELRRMKRRVKRRACDLLGQFILKCDRPGRRCRLAIATTGEEAAQPATREALGT